MVDLLLGQHGEEVFVEVSQVSGLGGLVFLETLLSDCHGDCPVVGRVGGSQDETVVFEAAHDTGDAALAERSAAPKFCHRHGAVLGKDGEEEQDLVLVK